MNIVETQKKGFHKAYQRITQRFQILDDSVKRKVEDILNDVRTHGDGALQRLTKKYDGVILRPKQFQISLSGKDQRNKGLSIAQMKSLRYAAQQIRSFHKNQKTVGWSRRKNGTMVGQLVRPLGCVGVYVPGGSASYPSSVLMNAIPADVAGVKRIIMCTPPSENGVHLSLRKAAELAGVHEIYQVGGAQAIGAMAFGTKTIPRVDKIVGPGNIFVATAKRLVYGAVDIDMVAGPSEVLIIVDGTANPAYVAADLLAQAEHDEKAAALMITSSLLMARKVQREVHHQLAGLKRKAIASVSIKDFGTIFVVKGVKEILKLANDIAPEHLELAVKNPRKWVPQIFNAGAIFMGHFTTEPVGDYVAGPNHVLPTGGTARFFSPLCVEDFLKKTSLIEYGKKGLERVRKAILELSEMEGLEAHGKAVDIRFSGH